MGNEGILLIIILCIGLAAGFGLGIEHAGSDYEEQAISRGCALHCPTNGNFAWNGECEWRIGQRFGTLEQSFYILVLKTRL